MEPRAWYMRGKCSVRGLNHQSSSHPLGEESKEGREVGQLFPRRLKLKCRHKDGHYTLGTRYIYSLLPVMINLQRQKENVLCVTLSHWERSLASWKAAELTLLSLLSGSQISDFFSAIKQLYGLQKIMQYLWSPIALSVVEELGKDVSRFLLISIFSSKTLQRSNHTALTALGDTLCFLF